MRFFWVLILTLLVAGCGSDSVDGVVEVPPTTQSITYRGFFLGRVMEQHPTQGTEVEVQTVDGATLYRLTTAANGFFWQRKAELPDDFRVVARPRAGGVLYATEVRGGWHEGTCYVNAITTVQSRYMRKHPEFGLEEATRRVKNLFLLRSDYSLQWVSLLANPALDMGKFWTQAALRGGVDAYINELTGRIDAPARGERARVLELESNYYDYFGPEFGDVADVAKEETASVAEQLAEKAGETVINDTLSIAFRGIAGHVLSAVGFNLGTSGEVNQAIVLLEEVLAEINELNTAVTQATLEQQINGYVTNMNTTLATFKSQTTAINATLNGYTATNTPLAQASPPSPAVINSTNTGLTTIFGNLFPSQGQPGLIVDYTQLQMSNLTFANPTTVYHGYPFRTNAMTLAQQNNLNFYLNYVGQGVNLIAEAAGQSGLGSTTLAVIQSTAHTYMQQAATQVQNARLQVPDHLPNNRYRILVDNQGGQYDLCADLNQNTMFYGYFFPQSNWDDAQSMAINFEIGPYTDWQLGSKDNFTALTQDRLLGSVADSDSASDWEGAFSLFGFNTENYGAYHVDGLTQDGDQGQSFMATEDDVTNNNVYQWQGTISNPSTATYNPSASGDTSTFLLTRLYPDTAEGSAGAEAAPNTIISPNTYLFASGVPLIEVAPSPSGPLPSPIQLDPLPSPLATPPVLPSPPGPAPSPGSMPYRVLLVARQSMGGNGYSGVNGGQPMSITEFCTWTSSNPTAASVSTGRGFDAANPYAPPGIIGTVFWHPNPSGSPLPNVQINASFQALTDVGTWSTLTGTYTMVPPAGMRPVPSSLQVTPINFLFDLVNNTQQTRSFTAVAYYADGQYYDVSQGSAITWQLLDPQGNVVNATYGGFGQITGPSSQNILLLNNTLPASLTTGCTVKATYVDPLGNQFVGTTQIGAQVKTASSAVEKTVRQLMSW